MIPLVEEIKAVLGEGAPAASPEVSAAPLLTPDHLLRLGWLDPETWAPLLDTACRENGITTAENRAAFLARCGVESGNGQHLVESFNYTPDALLKTWPKHFTPELAAKMGRGAGKAADERAIANAAYDGRNGNNMPGDGWTYRGRGLMQVTGRNNYSRLAVIINSPMERLPMTLETPAGAADSAARWWRLAGCNPFGDRFDVVTCVSIINGGSIGLIETQAGAKLALAVLRGA